MSKEITDGVASGIANALSPRGRPTKWRHCTKNRLPKNGRAWIYETYFVSQLKFRIKILSPMAILGLSGTDLPENWPQHKPPFETLLSFDTKSRPYTHFFHRLGIQSYKDSMCYSNRSLEKLKSFLGNTVPTKSLLSDAFYPKECGGTFSANYSLSSI